MIAQSGGEDTLFSMVKQVGDVDNAGNVRIWIWKYKY